MRERHAVAAVVLDVGEHLTDPVMFLWVLAPVFESVAVFCFWIELRNGIGECWRCDEPRIEAIYFDLSSYIDGVAKCEA